MNTFTRVSFTICFFLAAAVSFAGSEEEMLRLESMIQRHNPYPVRFRAVARIVEQEYYHSIPHLIDVIEDANPYFRNVVGGALERLVGVQGVAYTREAWCQAWTARQQDLEAEREKRITLEILKKQFEQEKKREETELSQKEKEILATVERLQALKAKQLAEEREKRENEARARAEAIAKELARLGRTPQKSGEWDYGRVAETEAGAFRVVEVSGRPARTDGEREAPKPEPKRTEEWRPTRIERAESDKSEARVTRESPEPKTPPAVRSAERPSIDDEPPVAEPEPARTAPVLFDPRVPVAEREDGPRGETVPDTPTAQTDPSGSGPAVAEKEPAVIAADPDISERDTTAVEIAKRPPEVRIDVPDVPETEDTGAATAGHPVATRDKNGKAAIGVFADPYDGLRHSGRKTRKIELTDPTDTFNATIDIKGSDIKGISGQGRGDDSDAARDEAPEKSGGLPDEDADTAGKAAAPGENDDRNVAYITVRDALMDRLLNNVTDEQAMGPIINAALKGDVENRYAFVQEMIMFLRNARSEGERDFLRTALQCVTQNSSRYDTAERWQEWLDNRRKNRRLEIALEK